MKTNQQLHKTLKAGIFAAALFCSASVFAQVKIGANPTTIDPANNLEVESADPAKKVSIDKTTGKVTIADGSQGDAKILTSDAAGVATWQSTSSLRIPRTAFTGYFTGDVALNTGTTAGVRIPFTTNNPIGDWDATNRQYTIPENGIYRIEFNAQLDNTVSGKTYFNQWVVLFVSGSIFKTASFTVNGPSAGWGPALFVTGTFVAGDKVEIDIYSYDITGPLIVDPMKFTNGSLIVTKLD